MFSRILLIAGILFAIAGLWTNDYFDPDLAIAANGKSKQEELRMELIQDIQKKQEALKAREEELDRREERVKSLEADIDKKISELKRLEARLDELIKIRDDVEERNIAALSKTYSSMKPNEAAARLKSMERRIALKILAQIKAKKASKILESFDPETASEITEQLAKRQLE